MLVTATVEQLLTGYPLQECRCSYCKTTLHEGDRVRGYAVQYAGDERWSVPRLYCWDCRPDEFISMTLGATELLVDGTLVTVMDVTRQRSSVSLNEATPVARSVPEEDDAVL